MADFRIEGEISLKERGNGFDKAADGAERLDKSLRKAERGVSAFDVAAGGLLAGGVTAIADMFISGAQAAFQFGQEAIQLGSDAAETESLLTNALGPAFDAFAESVDAVGAATGRSTNEFKQAVSPILAMTKAQGFAADEAGRVSVEFGKAALDLNSYFNSTTGFEDLQSALAGSSETLQKYGINANVAAINQEALNLGISNGLDPLTQQQRTVALLSLVQTQASDAMGDAARTADGFANTQRALTDTFSDFKTEVGASLVEAFAPLQKELLALSRENLPELATRLDEIIKKTGDTALGFVELTKSIRASEFGQNFAIANQAIIDFDKNSNEALDAFLEKLGISRIDLQEMGAAAREAQEEMARYENVVSGATVTQEAFQKGFDGSEFFVPDPEPVSYYTDRLAVLSDVAINAGAIFEDTAFSVDFLNQAFGGAFSPVDTSSFITTRTNPLDIMSDVTSSINDQFGDFNFNALEMNQGFEGIGESADEAARRVGGFSRSIRSANEAASEFSTGDLIGISGDADKGVADYVAEYAAKMNLPIDQTIAILEAQGLSQEEINAKTEELLEKASAFDIVNQLSSGALGADGLGAAIEATQLGISELEDPIAAVTNSTSELYDVVNSLNGNFDMVLTATIEGLDQVRELATLAQEITGQEFPSLNSSGASSGESAAELRSARR